MCATVYKWICLNLCVCVRLCAHVQNINYFNSNLLLRYIDSATIHTYIIDHASAKILVQATAAMIKQSKYGNVCDFFFRKERKKQQQIIPNFYDEKFQSIVNFKADNDDDAIAITKVTLSFHVCS